MTIETEELPCNFVGRFKVGDNLGFNCEILCNLLASNKDGALNKLVVLQIGSILEAGLSQIIFRAQHYNREGVPHISEADRIAIEGKKIDKFNTVIDVLQKYRVLDELGADIYVDLHNLRRYRNKIHIQDEIRIAGVSKDDDEAFSDQICSWALGLNLRVIRHLSEHLHRPPHLDDYVNPIRVPIRW